MQPLYCRLQYKRKDLINIMDNNLSQIPKLSNIIAAILCDISKAQDISNRYTLELAKQYKDDPSSLLKEFPVPNGVLNELKIEFKLALEDVLEDEQDFNSFKYYRQAFENVSDKIALDASNELIKFIKNSCSTNEVKNIINQIAISLNSTRWLHYLSDEIMKSLCEIAKKNNFASLSTKPEAKVIDELIEILIQKLIRHQDIINLNLGDTLINNIISNIKTYKDRWLDQIWQDLSEYKKSMMVPTLFSKIRSSEVHGSDQYANFCINVSVRDYIWEVVVEENADKTKVTTHRLIRKYNK